MSAQEAWREQQREAFVQRLHNTIDVARDLDDLDLSAPERDVWNACALLAQALGKYGIAVRDEIWAELLYDRVGEL